MEHPEENPLSPEEREEIEKLFGPGAAERIIDAHADGVTLEGRTYQCNTVDLYTDGKEICAMIGPDPVQVSPGTVIPSMKHSACSLTSWSAMACGLKLPMTGIRSTGPRRRKLQIDPNRSSLSAARHNIGGRLEQVNRLPRSVKICARKRGTGDNACFPRD